MDVFNILMLSVNLSDMNFLFLVIAQLTIS